MNPDTLETDQHRVYAGGDVTRACGSVVLAVAAGRRAAAAIDRALGGDGDFEETLFERPAVQHRLGREEDFVDRRREAMPLRAPAYRRCSFQEIALGFSAANATREARRCLQCDLRLHLRGNPRAAEKYLAYTDANLDKVPQTEGVYRLLDGNHRVLAIKGTENLRSGLREALEGRLRACWFDFEEAELYSRRESELIHLFVREHGRMPGQDDDLW